MQVLIFQRFMFKFQFLRMEDPEEDELPLDAANNYDYFQGWICFKFNELLKK